MKNVIIKLSAQVLETLFLSALVPNLLYIFLLLSETVTWTFFLVWLSTSYGCSSLLLKKVYKLHFRVFFILNLFCILFFSWGIPKLNLILIRIWRKFEIRVVKYSNKKCALFFWYLCILAWIFKKLSVLSCKWNSREQYMINKKTGWVRLVYNFFYFTVITSRIYLTHCTQSRKKLQSHDVFEDIQVQSSQKRALQSPE